MKRLFSLWSVRLVRSRMLPFHGKDTGLNPVPTTKKKQKVSILARSYNWLVRQVFHYNLDIIAETWKHRIVTGTGYEKIKK